MKYLCVQLDKLVRLRKTLDFGQILFVAFWTETKPTATIDQPMAISSQFNYVHII